MGLDTVVVLVGGSQAIPLEEQGPRAMEDFAIDRIVEIFGSSIRKHADRCITTAWKGDPFTLGSWAGARPGKTHQRKALARSVDDRLFFAGEATMIGAQGTCHGAYQSGQSMAQEIASALGKYPPESPAQPSVEGSLLT
jgi:monoamine oxidase